jgi:hypothetical protein
VIRMRKRRPSRGFYSLADAPPGGWKPSRGVKVIAVILAFGLGMTAVQMSARSPAQTSGESKLAGSAQSANTSAKQAGPQQPLQAPQAVMRTVNVKFDYDFSRFPACSAKFTQKCVQQFNVYEVSAKPPIFLFSVPVPPNAKGKMTGITGSAPQKQSFFTGPHRFGVTAKGPGLNYESDPYHAMTFAEVLPDSAVAPAPSNSAPKQ